MHILVSNFTIIFNKLQACAMSSTEHFLGPSGKICFFHFLGMFLGDEFIDQI